MKVSYVFIAAAQASPKSTQQWLVDNWWTIAVETFNFASNDWAKFSGAVDAVSLMKLKWTVWEIVRVRWGLSFVKCPVRIVRLSLVIVWFKVDQSIFPPLFDWCNPNGDSEISSEELINGSQKISDYFDVPNDYQAHMVWAERDACILWFISKDSKLIAIYRAN